MGQHTHFTTPECVDLFGSFRKCFFVRGDMGKHAYLPHEGLI